MESLKTLQFERLPSTSSRERVSPALLSITDCRILPLFTSPGGSTERASLALAPGRNISIFSTEARPAPILRASRCFAIKEGVRGTSHGKWSLDFITGHVLSASAAEGFLRLGHATGCARSRHSCGQLVKLFLMSPPEKQAITCRAREVDAGLARKA